MKIIGLTYTALVWAVLLASRSMSARWGNAFDCDEAYNYMEPAHFLLHGSGLQTWEYSPEYALRSYGYVGLHAFLGRAVSLLPGWSSQAISPKVAEFYAIRALCSLFCCCSEVLLVTSLKKAVSFTSSLITLIFLACSPGMFSSSSAFLPSSTAMILVCSAYSLRLRSRTIDKPNLPVFLPALFACMSVLAAWPFVGLAVIPLGIDLLLTSFQNDKVKGILKLVLKLVLASLLVLIPLTLIDSQMFGKVVIAAWNIVKYNVVGGDSQLYGTAPWYFYIASGILNLGIVLPLAFLSLPFSFFFVTDNDKEKRRKNFLSSSLLLSAPFILWFAFMSAQAHKEERFLYVVYPLACASAGIGLDALSKMISPKLKFRTIVRLFILILAMCGFLAMSASRISAIQTNYGAAISSWHHLSDVELNGGFINERNINVCVGKEWYRFPGSFFLPGSHVKLKFIRSHFNGQLPQEFGNHTWDEPKYPFNDRNREEMSRYISEKSCHYLIDNEFDGQTEPFYSRNTMWRVIWSAPFLDASNSPRATRVFQIPGLSSKLNSFSRYLILRNEQLILSENNQTKNL